MATSRRAIPNPHMLKRWNTIGAGLAVDNSSEDAKRAWSQAWHLSAGLLPAMRYVCISD